jgi:hypothetical protein
MFRRKLNRQEQEQTSGSEYQPITVSYPAPEQDEQQETKGFRRRSLKVVAAILGLTPMILFIILEDITLPMVWLDRWSLLFAIVFVLHIVAVAIQYYVKKQVADSKGAYATAPRA